MLPSRLVVACGLAAGLSVLPALAQSSKPADPAPAAAAQPGGKKVVKTQDDLPRHVYQIEGKASEFVLTDEPFKAFVAKVKADTQSDLEQYQIDDRTTLQGYYTLLQQIAMFEGRYDDAAGYIEKVRELETKESKKLMTGQTLLSLIAAGKTTGSFKTSDPAFLAAFKTELDKRVRALPWEVVKDEVNQAKGRADIISRDLVLGSLKGSLDPVVEQAKGELTGDMVRSLVGIRVLLDLMLALQPTVGQVFGAIAADNLAKTAAAKDIWTPTQVTLTDSDNGAPVVIGIWDSGVDAAVFRRQMWTNDQEVAGNNKDDDGNGFVDDQHGIAFDLDSNRVPGLLQDLSDLRTDRAIMQRYMKGFTDITANVNSDEATAVKKYISSLKQEQVTPMMEDLQLFSGYCHGTHVAGIAAAGNPYARILAARISFDHRAIPLRAPSVEQARKDAQAVIDTVAYFREAGVRVVNMSWGGSRQGIEEALEQKGVGATPEERAALSREIFKIGRDALEQAMRSAPEILFIAAAGNSDNDNEFSEVLPSGLSLPNMITVGAIDQSGKPTGFTTFGKNVKIYANGFEIESDLPGGEKQKMSGTSMAAPNAANLAGKLLALDPKLTTDQLIDLMTRGADPMPGHEGRLIINPKKTIELLRSRGG